MPGKAKEKHGKQGDAEAKLSTDKKRQGKEKPSMAMEQHSAEKIRRGEEHHSLLRLRISVPLNRSGIAMYWIAESLFRKEELWQSKLMLSEGIASDNRESQRN